MAAGRRTLDGSEQVGRTRLSRSESKALTRERLLEAARTVFLQQGFHATTVDQIAEEAGFTKGAVYSAFESKADIFLALYEERAERRAAEYLRFAEGAGRDEQTQAAMAEWVTVLRRDRDWSLVLIEFWVHAARDERLRQRFDSVHKTVRAALAEAIQATAHRSGRRLAAPSELLATAGMALANGFALEGFADPDVVAGDAYETIAPLLAEAFAPGPGDESPRGPAGPSGATNAGRAPRRPQTQRRKR